MNLHSAIRHICLLLAVSCLALAYALLGYPMALLAIPASILLWIVARKWSTFWADSGLLAVYLVLAVAGIMLKAAPLLIASGFIFALVAWDLSEFRHSLVGDAPPAQTAPLEKSRLQSLALMSGISLLLAVAGSQIRLHLPFGIVVLLALLVAGSVLYSVYRIEHREG